MRGTGGRTGALALLLAGGFSGCVYFNTMYDAGQSYEQGVEALQEGRSTLARARFDSVIAKTERVVRDHPDSKYADDAALLKTRSEIHNKLWAAAAESAEQARSLVTSRTDSAIALGLGGVAESQLDRPALADSLLSRALDAELEADDRATFLFYRGLVQLQLGRADRAAEDLQAAARQIDLTKEARLQLARALRSIGDYERSADVSIEIMRRSRFGPLDPAERAQFDTLSAEAPAVFENSLREIQQTPGLTPASVVMIQTLRGRALEHLGERDAAIAVLDSAAEGSRANQWTQEAGLRSALIRIRTATEPGDVIVTLQALEAARRSPRPTVRDTAGRMYESAVLFREFYNAWENRGSSAAEAALRAAEIAGTELGSPVVARGLYLLYLETVPDSPWTAKAIHGALSYSGHRPHGWVTDDGAETDARLVQRLGSLPVDDPYRVALLNTVSDRWADSTFVLAEGELERRILEIQMLFDTAVVRVRRDSIPLDAIQLRRHGGRRRAGGEGGGVLIGPVRRMSRSVGAERRKRHGGSSSRRPRSPRRRARAVRHGGFGLDRWRALSPTSVLHRGRDPGEAHRSPVREFGAGTRRLGACARGRDAVAGPLGRGFRCRTGGSRLCRRRCRSGPVPVPRPRGIVRDETRTSPVRRAKREPRVRCRTDRPPHGDGAGRLHGGRVPRTPGPRPRRHRSVRRSNAPRLRADSDAERARATLPGARSGPAGLGRRAHGVWHRHLPGLRGAGGRRQMAEVLHRGAGVRVGRSRMADLSQTLLGVRWQSPVMLASGTCGYGEEYDGLIPLNRIGGLVTKAVSLEPRHGNPPHRVAETPGGMINAIGLQNVGLEAFRRDKLPWLRDNLTEARTLINVVGHSEDDYVAVAQGLDSEEGFLGYEVNVSCPNVKDGTLFGTDPPALAKLVAALRRVTDRPLVVKLTPNVPDIGLYARICEESGADGLSAINTFPGMLIDVERRTPVIGNVTGGVSGPAILPMGVYLTWRARQATSLPIIGIGGIRSGSDALQYVLAGASLVQIGTALFVDPDVAVRVHEEIDEYCERHRRNLVELVGALELPGDRT